MNLQGEDRYRPAVAVIRRVVDELVVETEMRPCEHTDAIEGFEDLFRAGVGQLAVADDAAEPAGGEVKLTLMRDPIDCASQPERIVGAAPSRAGQRQAAGD